MKEITAYLADDGTVYQNPDDAARADPTGLLRDPEEKQ